MKSKLTIITRCQDCSYKKQSKGRINTAHKKNKKINKRYEFNLFCLLAKKQIDNIDEIPEWCPLPDNEIIPTPKGKKNYEKRDLKDIL